jgi:UDP-glucose 4-epimerase
MKVLIPGIASAVGRLVAKRLVDRGHDVIGIDRRAWPHPPEGIELHQLDIRKRPAEDVFRTRRPHVVIHMATVTHLTERTAERFRINLGGTQSVFHHCREYGVEHAIFVGRHTYYGAAPDSPLYHREDEPPMAIHNFPELADLVAADLYACTALWRFPELTTTVLRNCYALGESGHGTLGTFLRGSRIPLILGFDPLFQFMHEQDEAEAICLALDKRLRGVFNVAGPSPVPLSQIIRAAGRSALPLPERLLAALLGRFGLPHLPRGALDHIKYPIIIDADAFRKATGFNPTFDEAEVVRAYRRAFPPR